VTIKATVKGAVHPQIIFRKYLTLITVNKKFTIIITNYIWYRRYKEIIQITGEPPLRLHPMSDSKAGRRKVKFSDVTGARSTQSSNRHQLVLPILLALSSMIPLSSKQSKSSSSYNSSSGSNWYRWMSVSHNVNLSRLLRLVLDLFLANTCL